MVSLACLKICFRPTAMVLFFFISRSPLHCALSASIIGSVSHPVGDRPSHPICEVVFSECGNLKAQQHTFSVSRNILIYTGQSERRGALIDPQKKRRTEPADYHLYRSIRNGVSCSCSCWNGSPVKFPLWRVI